MSKDKTPSDYFPFGNDDFIVSEHMERLIEQEYKLITKHKPMVKLGKLFNQSAPKNKFMIRTNGAGQLSFFRKGNSLTPKMYFAISCRILVPAMGDKTKADLSFRFTIQINDKRFFFARLAAIKTEDGETTCNVCAIKSSDFSEYFFEGPNDSILRGGDLDIPITTDDLTAATRLDQDDLFNSIRLGSQLQFVDNEAKKVLIHLMKAANNFTI